MKLSIKGVGSFDDTAIDRTHELLENHHLLDKYTYQKLQLTEELYNVIALPPFRASLTHLVLLKKRYLVMLLPTLCFDNFSLISY